MVSVRFQGIWAATDRLQLAERGRWSTTAIDRGRVKTLETAVGTWRTGPIGRGEGRELTVVKSERWGYALMKATRSCVPKMFSARFRL